MTRMAAAASTRTAIIVPDAANHEEHDGRNQRDGVNRRKCVQIYRVFVDNSQHTEGEQQSGFGEADPAATKAYT